jgi:hypothetical protein
MSTLERAIVVAGEGHAASRTRAARRMSFAPLRMMLGLSSLDEWIVAVRHEVREDCPGWTLDRLRGEGFPDRIIAARDSPT